MTRDEKDESVKEWLGLVRRNAFESGPPMHRKILEPPRAMASLHFPTFSLTIGFDRHNVTRSNLPETHPALGGAIGKTYPTFPTPVQPSHCIVAWTSLLAGLARPFCFVGSGIQPARNFKIRETRGVTRIR